MLNFCDFIQVYVFSTNHHLNRSRFLEAVLISESYQGLSFGFMVTSLQGIHSLARVMNNEVKFSQALSKLSFLRNARSVDEIDLLNLQRSPFFILSDNPLKSCRMIITKW